MRLGLPLQELQAKTTSTEFDEWQAILEEDDNLSSKQDFYLAQIALEIRRANSKRPKRFKLSDLLIRFKTREELTPKKVMSEEEKKKHIAASKQAWLGAVGFGKPKKSKKKK